MELSKIKFRNVYRVECRDKNGKLRWMEEIPNQTMTAGINDLLNKYFAGAAYTAAFYVGLVDGASSPTFAATDTMAAHAGWNENTGYSGGTRSVLTPGAAAGGSINNSGSVASFTINANGTLAGAFVTTGNVSGGTAGTLFGAAAFSGGSRAVQNGDTVSVTITISAS